MSVFAGDEGGVDVGMASIVARTCACTVSSMSVDVMALGVCRHATDRMIRRANANKQYFDLSFKSEVEWLVC